MADDLTMNPVHADLHADCRAREQALRERIAELSRRIDGYAIVNAKAESELASLRDRIAALESQVAPKDEGE